MAVNGHLALDAEAHYLEPISEVAEFVDGPWRNRVLAVDPA
jgi:hypothetical protein